jgi:hypothetical protein
MPCRGKLCGHRPLRHKLLDAGSDFSDGGDFSVVDDQPFQVQHGQLQKVDAIRLQEIATDFFRRTTDYWCVSHFVGALDQRLSESIIPFVKRPGCGGGVLAGRL